MWFVRKKVSGDKGGFSSVEVRGKLREVDNSAPFKTSFICPVGPPLDNGDQKRRKPTYWSTYQPF